MKKIVVSSLVSLFVLSCSVTVPNNPSKINEDFSDLEKEYKSFSTKALSNVYVKRVFDKFLTVSPNPTQVIRQLEFARYLKGKSDTSYFDSLKTIIANENSIYTKIIAISGVSQKMTSESGTFGVFVQSISPLPGVPVATSATGITSTSFTANWNAVSDATSYIISVDGVETTLGNVTTYTKSGLTAGTTHTYSVKAVNSGGTGTNSNSINVALAPAAPVATISTGITSASFTANWNTALGATAYNLYIDDILSYTGNELTYTKSSLTPGISHSYYVQATNTSGTSSNSNTITTVLLPVAPIAPTASSATTITSTSFIANWTSVSGATSYIIVIDGVETTLGNVTTYTKSGLSGGTTYNYVVKAVNAGGTSSDSNTISVITVLPTPATLITTAVTNTGFTANWGAVSGATSYDVVIDGGAPVNITSGTSYNATGLTTEVNHTWKVRANKNLINSAYSSDQSVFTTSQRMVSTLAGTGTSGYTDGSVSSAKFYQPQGVAVDSAGNVYVGDSNNNVIRKITTGGVVSTIATGFNLPWGVTVDGSGNVYVADYVNQQIKKITSGGVVSTFAGTGTAGSSGDGGQATSAQFKYPAGVALDSLGNVYVADYINYKIRKITSSGIISTLASGVSSPIGLAVDSNGNVYVAGGSSNSIIKVTSAGVVSTFAGTGTAGYSGDGGQATSAMFNSPFGVAVDSSNNVYVADTNNHRIRKITPGGIVSTIAGTGTSGYLDGTGGTAQFKTPYAIAVDNSGSIYVADHSDHRIRKIQ